MNKPENLLNWVMLDDDFVKIETKEEWMAGIVDDVLEWLSYCLITTGQVTLDVLKKYVENQGK